MRPACGALVPPCVYRVRLTAGGRAVGKATSILDHDHRNDTVTVKLDAAARRKLAAQGRLRLEASARVFDADDRTQIRRAAFTVHR
jgi:hypothetical protein